MCKYSYWLGLKMLGIILVCRQMITSPLLWVQGPWQHHEHIIFCTLMKQQYEYFFACLQVCITKILLHKLQATHLTSQCWSFNAPVISFQKLLLFSQIHSYMQQLRMYIHIIHVYTQIWKYLHAYIIIRVPTSKQSSAMSSCNSVSSSMSFSSIILSPYTLLVSWSHRRTKSTGDFRQSGVEKRRP